MIVLKIELWPGGDETRSKEIGRTYVYNDGGTHDRGDYKVRVARKNAPTDLLSRAIIEANPKVILRTGEVKDYPRLSYNVWRLMIRALLSAFPEEKAK